MTPLFRKFLGMHWILVVAIAAMLVMGVLSVHAAIHFRPEPDLNNRWNDQIRWILLGIIPFFATSLIDYKWMRWAALPAYAAGVALLLLQDAKGEIVNGQKLSVTIAGVSFQASQFAVASTILLLAFILGEAHKFVPWLRHYFIRFLAVCIVFAIPFLLMLKLKDLGTAMVMLPIAGAMLLVGNIPFRCLIAALLIGLAAAPLVFVFKLKDYQQARIKVPIDLLLEKDVDRLGYAWNLTNILTGIGSAGWEGKGVNTEPRQEGQVSMLRLGLTSHRTAHTDFIFASASESYGFRGGAAIIIGFLFILTMSLTVAYFSRDQFGRLLVVGIIAQLFAHVFEHIGMNIGILPITGIPLPLISYGGTFLILNLCLLGLIQSVWVHRNCMVEEAPAPQRRPVINPRMRQAY